MTSPLAKRPSGAGSVDPQPDPQPGFERLVAVVQELSLARSLDAITAIVRRAARQLSGADGATFVLRDGDLCFYADEEAIAPLWKGKRFPMHSCASGWVMQQRRQLVIDDVFHDPRIPADAYRPTFVKSMAMVPIRTANPIGAIGIYWADHRQADDKEVMLLQALADSTSIAIENVQLYTDLERRVRERTAQLEAANSELEAFAYSVSHDLRAPLRAMDGFSRALAEDYGAVLDARGRGYLDRVRAGAARMDRLIDDLLDLSRARLGREAPCRAPVDISALARTIAAELQAAEPTRQVRVLVRDGLTARADPGLVAVLLQNLLANAFKFSRHSAHPTVEVGVDPTADGGRAFFVRDDGVGFDAARAPELFTAFQRLHSDSEFPGTGIGLATAQRIVQRHGGLIWAAASPGGGATFYWTLAPADSAQPARPRPVARLLASAL